jgi:hypothetical protein
MVEALRTAFRRSSCDRPHCSVDGRRPARPTLVCVDAALPGFADAFRPARPQDKPSRSNDAYRRATLHSVALWCIAFGRPLFGSGRQDTCAMRVLAISQFARLRIGIPLDYSIVHGPDSMLPPYAAPGIRPLAPDHSGGSASDVSHGPPSGCRARANGHCRRYWVWSRARGYVPGKSTPHQFWLLQSTPPLPISTVCIVVQRIAQLGPAPFEAAPMPPTVAYRPGGVITCPGRKTLSHP